MTIEAAIGRIERFADPSTIVTELDGGLTNRNYRVAANGVDYVVRCSSPDSSLLAIDRDNEEFNARAAATTEVSPPVFERLVDPPTLVVGWIEAATLSADALQEGMLMGSIAQALRQLHGGPPFRNRFDMFDIGDRYEAIAADRGLRLPEDYASFGETIQQIRSAFAAQPEPLVPCHNDLLAENLLWDDQRIWLIDFEYSGMNEPSFELGNLCSESQLTHAHLESLCEHYYGVDDPHRVARAELWGLVAKYRWTLWGIISADINPLEFDFWAWSMERYEVFRSVVRSPRFAKLLDNVALVPRDLPRAPRG